MFTMTSPSGRSMAILVAVLSLFVLAAILPEVACGQEGEDVDKVADALRILQELDRYYANVARPRLERRGAGGAVDADILDRAVRILQLQSLDKLYAHQTRPRFGKRSSLSSLFGRQQQQQQQKDVDADDWLKYSKRR